MMKHHRSRSRLRVVLAVTAAMCATALTPQAAAAPAPNAGSSDAAWGIHTQVVGSSEWMPIPLKDVVRGLGDGLANLLAPGEITRRLTPPPAPAPPAPVKSQNGKTYVPGVDFDPSKCPPLARICLDLDRELTWLQHDGHITYGPIKESAGAPYPATATPRGTFHVLRKVEHEVSHAFNEAPMPYSVYFTNTGIAFHQGSLDLWSHGCVHLTRHDAKYYFDHTNVGDKVVVF